MFNEQASTMVVAESDDKMHRGPKEELQKCQNTAEQYRAKEVHNCCQTVELRLFVF